MEWEQILMCKNIGLFCDNTTAVAYLKRREGTVQRFSFKKPKPFSTGSSRTHSSSPVHHREEECHNRFLQLQTPDHRFRVNPQPSGASRPKKKPVLIDLFAMSLNHQLANYYCAVQDPMALGEDAMLQNWNYRQVYAFPMSAMIRCVVNKLRSPVGTQRILMAP